MPYQHRQYTEVERSAIREEFSRRRRRQWALTIILLPFVVVALAYRGTRADRLLENPPLLSNPPRALVWPFAIIFLVLAVGGLFFSRRNWRCPGCSKYLGNSLNPRSAHTVPWPFAASA